MNSFFAFRTSALVAIVFSAVALAGAEAAKPHTTSGQSKVEGYLGSYNYSYPIKVPSFHGIEPKLSFAYNSNSKDGWLGQGWSLTGLPVIDRASPGKGAPAFDASDIYLLDGEELVPCVTGMEAASCAAGGTHTTKIESYLKIVRDTAANTWTVFQKDGTKTLFKPTYIASRIKSNCPEFSITGGVRSGWFYLTGLVSKGSWLEWHSGWDNGSGVLQPLTLKGFTASGGSPIGHQVYKMVGQGNRIDLYAFNDAVQLVVASSVYLQGATASGTIASVPDPGYGGIITLRGDGSRLWCTPYGSTPCGGSIELTPTTCPAPTEEVLGPSRWAVSEVSDTRVNKVTYNWQCEAKPNQECYPDSVTYNGTVIKIHRSVRPDPVSFVSGTQLGSAIKRISSVDVTTGGQRVRAYALKYAVSTTLTILNGITEYGTDATLDTAGNVTGGTTAPPVSFEYAGGGNGAGAATPMFKALCPSTARFGTADIDGDGLQDVWCNNNGENKVAYSRWKDTSGSALSVTQTIKTGWCNNTGTVGTADFTGDGKSDLWCMAGGTASTLVNSSGGFLSGSVAGFCSGGVFGTADVNGDGKADIWCRQSSGNLVVAPSLGSNLTTGVSFGTAVTWATAFCAPGDLTGAADFNGDGKADFFCHGAGRINVALSKGTTLGPRTIWASEYCKPYIPAGTTAVYPGALGAGDFNGDGKADVYCVGGNDEVRIGLSNGGTAFVGTDKLWLGGGFCGAVSPLGAADFDGDGKDDLWCSWASNRKVFYSQGSTYRPGVQRTTDSASWCPVNSKLGAADFTGDGRADFYCPHSSTDTNVSITGTGNAYGLISKVNATTSETLISYRSSAFWVSQNNPPVFQTVSRIEVELATGPSVIDYTYYGGRYDHLNRRFLGFSQSVMVKPENYQEPGNRPTTVTNYRLDDGFPTVPSTIVHRNSGANAMLVEGYNHTRYFGKVPYRSELTSESRSPNSGATSCVAPDCRATSITYQYDVYGNRKTIFDYGETAAAGDERTTTIYYPYNTAKYIVGLPGEVNVYKGTSSSGTRLQQSLFFYDKAAAVTTPIVTGNRTKTMRLVLPQNTYVQTLANYDTYGNLIDETNEVSAVTKYAYDTTYRVYQTSQTNAALQVSYTGWDYRCGAVNSLKDVNGQSTTVFYDALCREYKRTMPGGNFVNTKYLDFNTNNPRIRVETPGPQGGPVLWKEDTLDGLGRVFRQNSSGPSTAANISSMTFYLPRGPAWYRTLPYYSSGTAGGATEFFTYDALDRVTRSDWGSQATTTVHYGNRTVTTDENGRKTESMTDGRGRVIKRREWNGSTAVDTTFTYDDNDNIGTVTDAMGNVVTTTFDSLGRKTQIVDPDTGTTVNTYDAAGQLKTSKDARGAVTTYVYDSLGRVKSKTVTGGAVGATYTMEYDTVVTGSFNVGRLVKETFPAGSKTYAYDAAGRVTKETYVITGSGAGTYSFTYGYDAAGRLLYTTYPNGSTKGTAAAPIRYDGAGRLLSIPGVLNSVQYDAASNPTVITFANGAVTTKSYFPRLWTKSISTVSKGVTLQSLTYGRDAKGLKVTVTSVSPYLDESWVYSYDGLDRLSGAYNTAAPAENQTFTYDAIGNLKTNSRRGTYTYPAAKTARPHAVVSVNGGPAFQYDASGNLTSGDSRTYTWDGSGNMATVNGGGRSLQFSYDAHGERIRTVDNGAVILSLGNGYEVRSGVGAVSYFLGNTPIAEKRGSTMRFLHTDDMASVNVVTDAAGAQTRRITYRPFGDILKSTTTDFVSLGYTGEKRDSTNLMYLHARYYDPNLGRFVSPDSVVPAPTSTGFNRYAYAGNDPVNFTDRNGQNWLMDFGGSIWNGITTGLNSFGSYAFGSFGGSGFGAAGAGGFQGFNPSCFYCAGQLGNTAQLNFNPSVNSTSSGRGWMNTFAGSVAGNSGLALVASAAWHMGSSIYSGVNYIGGALLSASQGNLNIDSQAITKATFDSLGFRGGVGMPNEAKRAFEIASKHTKAMECVGCNNRADMWGDRLEKKGFEVRQATVITTSPSHMAFDKSGEAWNFHTAPAIRVGGEFYVIDPRWSPEGPLTMKDWSRQIGGTPIITERWSTGKVPWPGNYEPPDIFP